MAAPWQDNLFTDAIQPAFDHDTFTVNLTAGRPSIFEDHGLSLSDPTLALRNSSGTQLAFNDDGGPGLDSRIEFTPTQSGVYFLDAAGFGSRTGSFQVTSRLDDAADNIDTSPSDSRSNPGDGIAPGGVRSGTINNALDQDFFRINLAAGQNYTFDVIGGTLRDPTLAVRNSVGTQLAFNDDFGGSLNSHISFTAPSSGTYYLDVGGFSTNTGTYTLFG